jgi:hypothetical protein
MLKLRFRLQLFWILLKRIIAGLISIDLHKILIYRVSKYQQILFEALCFLKNIRPFLIQLINLFWLLFYFQRACRSRIRWLIFTRILLDFNRVFNFDVHFLKRFKGSWRCLCIISRHSNLPISINYLRVGKQWIRDFIFLRIFLFWNLPCLRWILCYLTICSGRR